MKNRSEFIASRSTAWTTFVALSLIALSCFLSSPSFASEKWSGVDESVVEKYAAEHGREARDPFINTDQGDLLLFVFLLAGAVGGFAAGYYWRILMVEKAPKADRKSNLEGITLSNSHKH